MKDVKDSTIKELTAVFAAGEITDDFLAACRADTRKAVGTLVRRYERAQK